MSGAGSLVVGRRFRGPPGSSNGGYLAGLLSACVGTDGPVQVTLRQPPPLDVALEVSSSADGATTLAVGGAVVAEARPGELSGPVVAPVDPSVAVAAMSRYAGAVGHPFPSCFVCGTDRPAPDGLGLRPGPVPGRPGTVATAWTPDPGLADEQGLLPAALGWAALDCPGGWSSDLAGRPMVLGRMTAIVADRPAAGAPCVVVGQRLGEQGRKTFTATAAYGPAGHLLGRAEQVWIEVR